MWEYRVEQVSLAERWSAKRQAEEMQRLRDLLSQAGKDGWEMISYESVPLYGAFSAKLKGYAYLLFFKRPAQDL